MIILTGGAGFIGSALLSYLNENGHNDILVVDRFREHGKWKNLRQANFYEFVHADELFTENYKNKLSKASLIFHMGACSSTTEQNMDYLYKNNVEYSQKLFQLATEKNIPFIYASSAATYGMGEKGYNDNEETLSQLAPLNAYGQSKQFFDLWILKQKVKPDIWFGLKFFNVFGPNEYHKGKMISVVNQAFHQITESGKVKLFKSHRKDYEDGGQKRDFVYVKDICKAMIQMAFHSKKENSGIYNMGTGQARTFKDLVLSTFKAMDRKDSIEYIPMPEGLINQYQYYTQANMDKFFRNFPEFKFSSLEEAVKDYVQNYLVHNSKTLSSLEK